MKLKKGSSTWVQATAGMSLVELLVVIVVLAIVMMIVVPGVSGMLGRADQSKRDAEILATAYIEALNAGNVQLLRRSEKREIIDLLVDGVPGDEDGAGLEFGVPKLDGRSRAGAAAYLEVRDGMLVYRPR